MTGNQDTAERAAAWAETVFNTLAPMIDALTARVKAVIAAALESDDLAVLMASARAIGAVARSASAVARLIASPQRRVVRPVENDDEEEREHDPDRDESPQGLERVRDELEDRVAEFAAVLDEKGLVVQSGRWPSLRPVGTPGRSAPASDPG